MFWTKPWLNRLYAVLLAVVFALLAAAYYFDNQWLLFTAVVGFAALLIAQLVRLLCWRQIAARFLASVADSLGLEKTRSSEDFPLPFIVVGPRREITWYTPRCRELVLGRRDVIGESLDCITRQPLEEFFCPEGSIVEYGEKGYQVHALEVEYRNKPFTVLYFIDVTEMKRKADEYELSRPVVMILMIDNYDELVDNAKESTKSQLIGEIDAEIENYFADTGGFVKRLNSSRFLSLVEERHYQGMAEKRFDILDRVRKIAANERMPVTLSIGIGRNGEHMGENELFARQSLDMAQGRGGDQAVVKTANGYDFYGGISKGVEKQTRVKSRIIATALAELIHESENVIAMGHRASDLDCVGSAIALAQAARRFGKPAAVVIDREHSLASSLIDRFSSIGHASLFVAPDEAEDYIGRDTLLIITDTHNPKMLESEEIYRQCERVVVIDHHRKMVNHIDNAVIFHHEPFASSASEMVTELLQYFGEERRPSKEEAEGLLAGIMLDTRNFSLRTGVRTFEAAAYLRRIGADTVSVTKLFSSSIEAYQQKSRLVQSAEIYRNCAIAMSEALGEGMQVVAPQAANELLNVSDVYASFVLFPTSRGISISARSMGEINVQVIMEKLGGGGHHTMAGTQFTDITMEEARQMLVEAIDQYFEDNKDLD